MITDADIKKMKVVFATKDDLELLSNKFETKFATKDDLKRFATKEDLEKFATKEDLKRFATKDDLQKSTNELVELITVGFDRTEKAIERLSEHDEIIDNHERRLDRVEDKVFA